MRFNGLFHVSIIFFFLLDIQIQFAITLYTQRDRCWPEQPYGSSSNYDNDYLTYHLCQADFHLFSFKERLSSFDPRSAGKLCVASGQFSNSSLFCESRRTSHLSTNMMISPSYRTCWGSEYVRNFSELFDARYTILQEPSWQAWLLDINFLPHIGRVLEPYDSSLTHFTL
jgi:hypothetical protein